MEAHRLTTRDLQVLVSVSRHLPHVSLLVREGAVPAILAALLAHVQRTHVVKAGLTIMKNIVADENVVSRFSGQGAYRILLTVMQAHNSHEHIELVCALDRPRSLSPACTRSPCREGAARARTALAGRGGRAIALGGSRPNANAMVVCRPSA